MNEIKKKEIRLLGDLEEFEDWINSKNTALGDVKSKDLMNAPEGLKLVYNALDCLSWGSYI
jgi:uncharacterized protein (DUF2384 family)